MRYAESLSEVAAEGGERVPGVPRLEPFGNHVEAETMRLETADGIREAAREDYGYVELGEERATVLPMPALPIDLPDGWPYNVVTEIIDTRTTGT